VCPSSVAEPVPGSPGSGSLVATVVFFKNDNVIHLRRQIGIW